MRLLNRRRTARRSSVDSMRSELASTSSLAAFFLAIDRRMLEEPSPFHVPPSSCRPVREHWIGTFRAGVGKATRWYDSQGGWGRPASS